MRKKGFTIIEIVMVIVIIGILAAVAIPRFDTFYFVKLHGAVKKVIQDIRYAQQLAISSHESYNVSFSTASDTYSVTRVSDGSYAPDPFTRGNLVVNFASDPEYSGIDIATANFGGSSVLTFDWKGRPQSAGSASFSYQDNTINLTVENNTGLVREQ
ncbi:MAG: GspH/FimT family protein [Candidatus Omnitrophota bacterium]|nr:GspH/FimT family protein [Candidatus Omnitrophota bacterium]